MDYNEDDAHQSGKSTGVEKGQHNFLCLFEREVDDSFYYVWLLLMVVVRHFIGSQVEYVPHVHSFGCASYIVICARINSQQ